MLGFCILNIVRDSGIKMYAFPVIQQAVIFSLHPTSIKMDLYCTANHMNNLKTLM